MEECHTTTVRRSHHRRNISSKTSSGRVGSLLSLSGGFVAEHVESEPVPLVLNELFAALIAREPSEFPAMFKEVITWEASINPSDRYGGKGSPCLCIVLHVEVQSLGDETNKAAIIVPSVRITNSGYREELVRNWFTDQCSLDTRLPDTILELGWDGFRETRKTSHCQHLIVKVPGRIAAKTHRCTDCSLVAEKGCWSNEPRKVLADKRLEHLPCHMAIRNAFTNYDKSEKPLVSTKARCQKRRGILG